MFEEETPAPTDIHPLDLAAKLESLPEPADILVNGSVVEINGEKFNQTTEATPVTDEAKALNASLDEAALDAALDAQGEIEPEVVEDEPSLQSQVNELRGRLALLEQRLDNHNLRSGHKI